MLAGMVARRAASRARPAGPGGRGRAGGTCARTSSRRTGCPKANAIENSYMFANGPWPVAIVRKTRLAAMARTLSHASRRRVVPDRGRPRPGGEGDRAGRQRDARGGQSRRPDARERIEDVAHEGEERAQRPRDEGVLGRAFPWCGAPQLLAGPVTAWRMSVTRDVNSASRSLSRRPTAATASELPPSGRGGELAPDPAVRDEEADHEPHDQEEAAEPDDRRPGVLGDVEAGVLGLALEGVA